VNLCYIDYGSDWRRYLAKHKIYYGDNLDILRTLPDNYANLIYIDPPFNTGKRQERRRIKVAQGIEWNNFDSSSVRSDANL